MPKEYREITFTQREVTDALLDMVRERRPGPHGPELTRVEENGGVAIGLNFGGERIIFAAAEITAALIRHARKIKVPVPRDARKAIEVSDAAVVLKLWLE